MRVFIELSQEVDAASWSTRHAAGLAADASPYGLHHLERFGHTVRFRRSPKVRALKRAAGVVAGRSWGLQPVHAALALTDPARRTADVVLCMDERNGIPAVFASRHTPVISGVAWLEDPADFDPRYVALARRALRKMAGVFVECPAMVDPLVNDFGVQPDRLHVIDLGIDECHFAPSGGPGIDGRVFSVGDDRMRDYTTLVGALRQVRAARSHMTAELATTLPLNLQEGWAVVHARRMDHAVRACYDRASVVALALRPTRQGSGLTVILEAMASGKPLVVTDNPGLSHYVRDGVNGLLVPGGRPEKMADAIMQLLDDPDRAAAMGREGRRMVEERFTTKHMAAGIDRVLRAAC